MYDYKLSSGVDYLFHSAITCVYIFRSIDVSSSKYNDFYLTGPRLNDSKLPSDVTWCNKLPTADLDGFK